MSLHRVFESHPYRVGETLASALTLEEAEREARTHRYGEVTEDVVATLLLALLDEPDHERRRRLLGEALTALRMEVRSSGLDALDSREAARHE